MNRRLALTLLISGAGLLPVMLYFAFFQGRPFPVPEPVVRSMTLFDQLLVVSTAFVVKPLYMSLSLGLAWMMRSTTRTELRALRWGFVAFFIGEAFCSINYLVFDDRSVFSEYLHNFGMVVAFGFISYALIEGLDRNVIQYSDPRRRCGFAGLCGECAKNGRWDCRLRRIFQAVAVMLALLALIPLLARMQEVSYETEIFGTHYNYVRLAAHLFFEIRYTPLLSLMLSLAALGFTWRAADRIVPDAARVLLSAAFGALGFGVFRLFFNAVFAENLARAAAWEEITEMMMVGSVLYVLWQFRERLAIAFPKFLQRAAS